MADSKEDKVFSFTPILSKTINKNGFMNHPMLSHIDGNLYVGMSPHYWDNPTAQGGATEHEDFREIFNYLHFPGYEYKVFPNQIMHAYKCWDDKGGGNPIPREIIREHALKINLALTQGYPVLVHCQMGINRSNLFAAAALCQQGYPVAAAIHLLQTKRSPWVLMNNSFVAILAEMYG